MSQRDNDSPTLTKPFLLRDVTLSSTHIAFCYGRNVWSVRHDGSDLRRLTSAGREAKPAFSPNGTHIAFLGEYDGSPSLYVVPAEGGEPCRLTYHPAEFAGTTLIGTTDFISWTPDGKRVLFSSRRTRFRSSGTQLFTVPREGGFPTQVPLVRAAMGSFSPDGKCIAYVQNTQTQPNWKRYRGGQTTAIWIVDLADSSIVAKIPWENSNDLYPIWVGDRVYFLSDRNGPVNLFVYDVKTGQVKELVKSGEFDIKSYSAISKAIVYEQFGTLHLLELASGNDRVLEVCPSADFPEVRPYFKNVTELIVEASCNPNLRSPVEPKLSPTGARVVLRAHGEILTIPTEKGNFRNVTRSVGISNIDPAWSPNGHSIAYFSDETGKYGLHVRDQSGAGEVRTILLGDGHNFYYAPNWSPDSKNIAYTDQRLNYWYVNLDLQVPVRIDTDLFTEFQGRRRLMSWSPDSRWIAYTRQLPSHLHAVFLYSLERVESYQVTDGMSDAQYVAFDKSGKYLYFTSSTDVGPSLAWINLSSVYRPVTRSVHAIVLKKGAPTPLAFRSDEENENPLVEPVGPVEIDVEDIGKRIIPLPILARNYQGLFAGKPGVVFLDEYPPIEPGPYGEKPHPRKIQKYDLATRKLEQFIEDVTYATVSYNGEKFLYGKDKQWLVTSTETPGLHGTALKLDGIAVYVDPRLEWKRLYAQVWRKERDFLYDPGLHGLDYSGVKKKYEPFVENIVTRDDLNYLFSDMLADITIGHMFATGPEVAQSASKIGLLGADYAVENGRYRIARIYERDPWNPTSRSPLTEPGMEVNTGEYVLAVNGEEIYPSVDIHKYFAETVDKQIVLRVGSDPSGKGAREVCVVPIDNEVPLRSFAWVEENRRKVDMLSGGRVAYIFMPDIGYDGFASFNRYFYAQIGRDAAIVDDRYNEGGKAADYVIDMLRRTLLHYFHMRDGQDITVPMLSIFGPKVMLINEMACSGGDILPWLFRKAGLGPLVGKRTWGGTVGSYGWPGYLSDGAGASAPNLAFYNEDGEWEIENHGTAPDIEVEDDPKAARAGGDSQLEKAVEVVLELLRKHPPLPAVPQHPPYPNYHA